MKLVFRQLPLMTWKLFAGFLLKLVTLPWVNPSYSPRVPVICGLARATKSDIDAAWEAVQHAARPRIHTFLATSPIHMRYKLKMDPEEVVDLTREMVAYAKGYCDDVQFSPEDAGRSDHEFLYLVLGEAIKGWCNNTQYS